MIQKGFEGFHERFQEDTEGFHYQGRVWTFPRVSGELKGRSWAFHRVLRHFSGFQKRSERSRGFQGHFMPFQGTSEESQERFGLFQGISVEVRVFPKGLRARLRVLWGTPHMVSVRFKWISGAFHAISEGFYGRLRGFSEYFKEFMKGSGSFRYYL